MEGVAVERHGVQYSDECRMGKNMNRLANAVTGERA
jgi:hypothetical protein